MVDGEGIGDVGETVTGAETEEEGTESVFGEDVIPVGKPWAARALTTASQPFSSVLIRSLSSSFSRSLASSDADLRTGVEGMRTGADCGTGRDIPIPARSWRFSSSSSATRRSRKEN